MRTYEGTLCRFDSVTEMVAACRDRFKTEDVRCVSKKNGEFMLRVSPAHGKDFESLIVHFEGERTYAVLLPDAEIISVPQPSPRPAKTGKTRRPWWRIMNRTDADD